MALEGKGDVICGFNKKQDEYNYVIVSHKIPLKKISKEFNLAINGKGGGSDMMLQGSCKADRETIEKSIKQLFNWNKSASVYVMHFCFLVIRLTIASLASIDIVCWYGIDLLSINYNSAATVVAFAIIIKCTIWSNIYYSSCDY